MERISQCSSSSIEAMKLVLKTAGTGSLQVQVSPTDTFQTLQLRVKEETGIQVNLCQIAFEDREIKPQMNVVEYFTSNGQSKVHGYNSDSDSENPEADTPALRLDTDSEGAAGENTMDGSKDSEGAAQEAEETLALRLPTDSESEPSPEETPTLHFPEETESELPARVADDPGGTAEETPIPAAVPVNVQQNWDGDPPPVDEFPAIQLCRLCAQPGEEMTFIYSEQGIRDELGMRINAWLPTRVSRRDPLPKQVCGKCVVKLEQCQQFGTAVLQAENTLKRLFKRQRQRMSKNRKPLEAVKDVPPLGIFTPTDPNQNGSEEKDIVAEQTMPVECNDCPLCCEGNMMTVDDLESTLLKDGLVSDSEPDIDYSVEDSDEKFDRELENYLDMNSDDDTDGRYDGSASDRDIDDEEAVVAKAVVPQENLPESVRVEEVRTEEVRTEEVRGCEIDENLLKAIEFIPKVEINAPTVKIPTEPLPCRICKEMMADVEQCMLHSIQAHGDTERGFFPCILCIVCFETSTDLTRHFSYKHEFTPAPNGLPNLEMEYFCYLCNARLNSHEDLLNHGCENGDRFRCNECGSVFDSKERLCFHIQLHEEGNKPLTCGTCKLVFTDETDFYEHVRTSHGEIPGKLNAHVCELCGRSYQSRSAYLIHARRHGRIKREFKCDLCLKTFRDKQTLKEHFPSHMDVKPFQCHICGKYLNRHSRLKNHILTHEMESVEPQPLYKCSTCGEVFPTEEKAVMHTQKSPCGDSAEDRKLFFELDSYNKVFLCEYCDRCYSSHEALNIHRNGHEEPRLFTCSVCGINFSTFSRVQTHKVAHGIFKEPMRTKDEAVDEIVVAKMFGCEECSKSYLHWTYLAVHRKLLHAEVKHMYHCKLCPAAFPNSWGIAYHRKTRHPEFPGGGTLAQRKPFKCEVCGCRYVSERSLLEHRTNQHPGDGTEIGISSFQCEECGKVFMKKLSLDSHMRSHSGEKPFSCTLCTKSFVHPSGLSSHMRRHKGDAPHSCSYCGKRFLQRSDLKDHERKHTGERPFPCEYCEKAFRTRAMWLQHIRIHRDERPFPCDICGQAFRRSYAMKNHRMIHTGERNFSCYKCGQMFRIKQDLQKHEKTKHSEQEDEQAALLLKLHLDRNR